jgi:mannosyltransferase
MAAVAARLRALPWISARSTAIALTGVGLGVLALLSLYLRTQAIDAAFWIDEGLSVGIARHDFFDIPVVLQQDGSPPLYYMTLHAWMSVFGDTEEATHALSLVCATLCIPAAFWAAHRPWGVRAAWFASIIAAFLPFLTIHGQETRMYALMPLLSILTTGCFLRAYVLRDRRFVPLFGLALASMLYTHNWALFFTAATLGATLFLIWDGKEMRRDLIKDGLFGFGIAALLYAPWLPTLYSQAQSTAAPWSNSPGTYEPTRQLSRVLGGYGPAMALAVGGGLGLATIWQRGKDAARERRMFIVCTIMIVGLILLAWVASQANPAWTNRYFAVVVGPVIVLAAGGLRHSGRAAIVATVLLCLFWYQPHPYGESKASERNVATNISALLEPGDLVISTHPERMPVISYYLDTPGLQYATTLGRTPDPGVMDWRDALPRLQKSRVDNTLEPLLDTVPVGAHVLIVRPVIRSDASWRAPWTKLVRRRSAQWSKTLARDERFGRIEVEPFRYGDVLDGVRATLYTKIADG